ncbi:NADPH-dependent FMN reductase [Lutimonas zeaxanthinifaciens]|uniref:NADPH-dependent FMN reductase n=1 Tax=Lutimonas zeaxanthinifaciens TaxID=3060215 RepID=UPI00265D428B|nr:NAD(P)H-dependent oxidoreductase [Lutimonas sp. YSD2104]WKK64825.1 NAD(P)H-dependent oxidoreductase [Lutimonas sp. YSD2104]
MKKVMTIGGSNSKASINRKLAEYTGRLMHDVELNHIDLNDFDLPLFSIDIENESGFPKDLIRLNNEVNSSDGFVISLAEHNGAYSAAFKNAFDWLSRMESKVWRNKPMLLLSTSPGARGGQSVMEIALSRFPRNGGNIIGHTTFPSFNENFIEGEIVNPELKAKIEGLVSDLSESI